MTHEAFPDHHGANYAPGRLTRPGMGLGIAAGMRAPWSPIRSLPIMSHVPDEPLVAARFTVLAEASLGLLSRVLEPFAKRDLIPDSVRAQRDGEGVRAEVALHAMPLGMVHLVAGNLGQIIGVSGVEAMEGRVVRLAA
jgi:hypothetical protein